MGMFDTLKYQIDCPECGSPVPDFQTKDLQCILDEFKKGDKVELDVHPIKKQYVTGIMAYDKCKKCNCWIDIIVAIKNDILGDIIKIEHRPNKSVDLI